MASSISWIDDAKPVAGVVVVDVSAGAVVVVVVVVLVVVVLAEVVVVGAVVDEPTVDEVDDVLLVVAVVAVVVVLVCDVLVFVAEGDAVVVSSGSPNVVDVSEARLGTSDPLVPQAAERIPQRAITQRVRPLIVIALSLIHI